MKSDVWRKSIGPRGGWTVRPRNAWRPLTYFNLTVRRFDSRPPRPGTLKAHELAVRFNRFWLGTSIPEQRRCVTATWRGRNFQVMLTTHANRRLGAERCLLGTGYGIRGWERRLQRHARNVLAS